MVTPCTWGLKVFRSPVGPIENAKYQKFLNYLVTMVKIYSNKPKINCHGNLNWIRAAFVDTTIPF